MKKRMSSNKKICHTQDICISAIVLPRTLPAPIISCRSPRHSGQPETCWASHVVNGPCLESRPSPPSSPAPLWGLTWSQAPAPATLPTVPSSGAAPTAASHGPKEAPAGARSSWPERGGWAQPRRAVTAAATAGTLRAPPGPARA